MRLSRAQVAGSVSLTARKSCPASSMVPGRESKLPGRRANFSSGANSRLTSEEEGEYAQSKKAARRRGVPAEQAELVIIDGAKVCSERAREE
jgi:hypothetical protein